MKIVAVTACPAGLAHTFMAKKALENAAKELGHTIKVETQGAMGIENEITKEDIANSDVAILAIDSYIEKMNRFKEIPTIEVSTKAALKDARALIKKALAKINK
ncbi:PTS system IIB component, Fru family [Caminicella sporogenes DSM 14501]|uniref:PTS system IIB component, Fru family n=1 Tax=Caminicella sporogenes DSM 14501 TaxID=1121266 RepID=A0A1M6THY8_9FIRM|nr:PTS fructose transporter subunit IIB [Caminicella sporogenes]RKD24857.1 PTS fructose transporter subunit IIB [Caminicella sporogenes]SHK56540.1 PTS system IIB component, Fru family [Caminicella sporogenes DSM 14501]